MVTSSLLPPTFDPRVTRPMIGKYELIASLGRGGMADVFLALARGVGGFHKLVVIKCLRDDLGDDAPFRAMLLDEARLAARLQHPNIVQTFEVGVHDGSHYIAMEYLNGQPLHRVLMAALRTRPHAFEPALAMRIVIDMLHGLHHAHELCDYDGTPLHVVHRDVSPQNIFVTYDGEVKLVDFGVAKAASAEVVTEVGFYKGKLPYIAPEQLRGARLDRRVDVYAAGIVLWELLAKRRFSRATTLGEALERLKANAPRVRSHEPSIDPVLDAIVARALERDPDRRFQTARELAECLERHLEALTERPPRRDQLGALVTGLFEHERASLRARIDEFMRTVPTTVLDLSSSAHQLPALDSQLIGRGTGVGVQGPASPSSAVAPTPAAPKQLWRIAGLAGLAVVAAAVLISLAHRDKPAAAAATLVAPPAPREHRVVLRLCGSNTIGAELAPALAAAFLQRHGDARIARRPTGQPNEVELSAETAGGVDAIVIRAAGTATAFKELAAGDCDIGMASRPVNDGEVSSLAALADPGFRDVRAPASEHVLALDGIAVITHPNNPVKALDVATLGAIFAGAHRDWSELGLPAGPIHVYARDDASGTYDMFRHLVLGSRALTTAATRLSDSEQLSTAVATDRGGIGFVGLAYVRTAKSIAIADHGVAAMLPSPFTVTTESYPLSRRLYLYSSASPRSPATLDFVSFALSSHGQAVVRDTGFIDLDVGLDAARTCDARCTRPYAAAVASARRMSLDFRFRTGTSELDSRAVRDLERLVRFLHAHPGKRLVLLGFSDAAGGQARNLALSRERAQAVAAELATRGIEAATVDGFGADMPVATNATDAGRERNRRVEVWLEAD